VVNKLEHLQFSMTTAWSKYVSYYSLTRINDYSVVELFYKQCLFAYCHPERSRGRL